MPPVSQFQQVHRNFRTVILLALCAGALLQDPRGALADSFRSPDILVLGDSQLSFGAGHVLTEFFQNFKSRCGDVVDPMHVVDEIAMMRTAMLGVRSTSLDSWLTKTGSSRAKLCRKDPKWGVNASVWGSLKKPQKAKTFYVQIGEGRKYQFCKRNQTALQSMLADGYYKPRLLIFNLLGNGVGRWAAGPKSARKDVMRLAKQLPSGLPCVFMTTMPNYKKWRNRKRLKAQKNIEAAFAANGNRCAFVRGLTPKTIAALQGQAKYFRRRKSGAVKDPFHPNMKATKKALSFTRKSLCQAVVDALGAKRVSVKTADGVSVGAASE